MTLLACLGNIGSEYEDTRHNAGFMLADQILADGGFSDVTSSKFKGQLFKKSSLLILKPSTFMNLSGLSVKAVCDFYKPDHLIVAHDELDLNLGALKFKFAGSNAGHNGLKSIDGLMGNSYDRIRIGIGNNKGKTISHVLGKFSSQEKQILEAVLAQAKKAAYELIQTKDIKSIASKYTLKAK